MRSTARLAHHPSPPLYSYSYPPAPLYVAFMIFCATSEKDSEKPVNSNSRYLPYSKKL